MEDIHCSRTFLLLLYQITTNLGCKIPNSTNILSYHSGQKYKLSLCESSWRVRRTVFISGNLGEKIWFLIFSKLPRLPAFFALCPPECNLITTKWAFLVISPPSVPTFFTWMLPFDYIIVTRITLNHLPITTNFRDLDVDKLQELQSRRLPSHGS